MKSLTFPTRLLLAGAVALGLAGCLNLKPARATARYFVLGSTAGPAAARPAPGAAPARSLGIGPVKMPLYLLKSNLAVRKTTNEVEYLETAFWAERLDHGFQRVLAADLAALLPADQIRLSAWRREEVSEEIYVTVERFEVSAAGQGTLVAWWRILSPGGEKTLKAGQCRASRQGPPPGTDPEGATATLSELVTDLGRELAQALNQFPTPTAK
jgi:uncharacterized lipoprotein YmbA